MRSDYREEPCRTALNRVKGMRFEWSLNPYMGCAHRCTFCYVRAFERRAGRPSDDRYGASLRVKVNIVEVLRAELRRRSWRGELVAIGAATDPYQPAEARYRLTRGCLEALSARRNPLSIITRGPLVVRDIDVLQEASRRATTTVNVSIPTLSRDVWRTTEPGTAPPHSRMRAVAALSAAGIRVAVAIAPILPGLTDDSAGIEATIHAARNAGAVDIWARVLDLRPGTREHFLSCLARDWPELLPKYQEMYASGGYLPAIATKPMTDLVRTLERRAKRASRFPTPLEAEEPPAQGALAFQL